MSLLARISGRTEDGRQTPIDGLPMDVDDDDGGSNQYQQHDVSEPLPRLRDITCSWNGGEDEEDQVDWDDDDDIRVCDGDSVPAQPLSPAHAVPPTCGPAAFTPVPATRHRSDYVHSEIGLGENEED